MVICPVSVDLGRAYPTSHPMTVGDRHQHTYDLLGHLGVDNGWVDIHLLQMV